VIVEFDGYGLSEGSGGKYVKWKQTLASGLEDVFLYNDDSVKLIFTVRSEDYQLENEVSNFDKRIPDVVKKTGRMTSLRPLSSEELQTDYKMKLLQFKYGDVIKK